MPNRYFAAVFSLGMGVDGLVERFTGRRRETASSAKKYTDWHGKYFGETEKFMTRDKVDELEKEGGDGAFEADGHSGQK